MSGSGVPDVYRLDRVRPRPGDHRHVHSNEPRAAGGGLRIAYGRKVCFVGRSMINVTTVAMELGELVILRDSVLEIDDLTNYRRSDPGHHHRFPGRAP